ncbi:MAG TPA: hypothetical protein VFI62_13295 [Burkholderiales bacterium]|nr:hypothetical protein [Burkholderiales bacterium]
MDPQLTPEEYQALSMLDTAAPVKPEINSPTGDALVEKGLAIRLVEGGLQLTTLGRERLSQPEQQEHSQRAGAR